MTDWLTNWLIGWLTNWLTDCLTAWLTDWLTDWPTDRPDWLIDWLTDWLTIWATDWLTDWLTDYLIYWLTDWLIDWLTDLTNWLTDWLTEAVLRDFSSKTKLWRSKTKHFCETSFRNEALKLKNETFVREFPQKRTSEDQKQSISARLLSKTKLWISKISFCARLPSKKKLLRSKAKRFCETSFKNEALKVKNEACLRDFLQNRSFDDQKRSFCARLPSKWSFEVQKRNISARLPSKNEALKLKNETFVRDFLQKRSFEVQKRSISARLPSKTKLWSSKTKLLCETSFKNEALKIKNKAFLRDFLQKWSFEVQKRSFCARLPSKMKLWRSKTKHFCETSFKNYMLTGHLTSELQYVLMIFNWMLQKYCACHRIPVTATRNDHCKVTLPWHEICNPSTDSASRLQTSTSQSTKSLRLPRETRRFGASSNPPRLPTFLQPSQTPAPATHFETYRNPCACHAKTTLNLKKWSEARVF